MARYTPASRPRTGAHGVLVAQSSSAGAPARAAPDSGPAERVLREGKVAHASVGPLEEDV
jgi:hypothetical protein